MPQSAHDPRSALPRHDQRRWDVESGAGSPWSRKPRLNSVVVDAHNRPRVTNTPKINVQTEVVGIVRRDELDILLRLPFIGRRGPTSWLSPRKGNRRGIADVEATLVIDARRVIVHSHRQPYRTWGRRVDRKQVVNERT